MYEDIINVAVMNFKVAAGKKDVNLNKMKGLSVAAAKRGANLILFPELCVMGYDFYIDEKIDIKEKIKQTETLDGRVCKELAEVAKEHDLYIVFGTAEKINEDDTTLYNSAIAIGPEGVMGSYKKIHPFDSENTWCAKGDTPFMFDTKWGPISVGICYDSYQFPELMRYYVSKGSRLYLNPTALSEEISKEGSRQAFINYYAPTLEYGVLSNTIYIASSNLTGYDDFNYFGGGCAIIGPKVNAFFETDMHYYAGNKDNVQAELFVETIDLSLATTPLFKNNRITNTPDYRLDVYKKFID